MAPRPGWKGYLELSLVACAVELTSATDHSEKVSFRGGSRLRARKPAKRAAKSASRKSA